MANEFRKILVVDDDQEIVALLVAQLKHLGVKTIGATTHEAALAALTNSPPDAMLLDLVMPGPGGGLGILKLLRQMPTLIRFLPVVIASGHPARQLVETASRLGATEFLVKPWTEEELAQKLAKVLPPLLDGPPIRDNLAKSHIEDQTILAQPGVTGFKSDHWRAFPVKDGGQRYAYLVQRPHRPAQLAAAPEPELVRSLCIFLRQDNGNWTHIWPSPGLAAACAQDDTATGARNTPATGS